MMANLVWTNETVSEMCFIEELSGPLCSSEVLILLAISGSILELLMLIIFFLAKKPKLTPEEEAEKMYREQHYIVSKIRDYKSLVGNNTSSITNLPILT